ncbi:ATP phosphoribosyltransferase regulatory subunit [Pseudahrensia aquimaris]|uniref:ATP phosphoribosyltransferase regulatory subunit n=1 Tax=Pseudahrensia aquimaris TaxID=744461 RepID=A0ABW3FEI2_9HYPH
MLDNLLTHLAAKADHVADLPILQSADPFLETAGEDLRRRMFITESADGALQCLRPEFTIPICLHYASQPGRYAYGGTVFRQGRESGVEFKQVGLEDLGNTDKITADVASIMDMMNALNAAGMQAPNLTLGDQTLFAELVHALDMPAALVSRLERNFGAADALERVIDEVAGAARTAQDHADPAIARMAASEDVTGLEAAVMSRMEAGGLSPRSGRSPGDIVARMIEKARAAHFQLASERAEKLRAFLRLEAPLNGATDALAEFAAQHELNFGKALDDFKARLEGLEGQGLDLAAHTYRASFGRKLEYYTGILFEVNASGESVAGGGRYDRLCSLLGAAGPVPAVGFSITLDRLEKAIGEGA